MAIQDEIPKSRLTLRYKTIIGQPEDMSLPIKLFISYYFSQGMLTDRVIY